MNRQQPKVLPVSVPWMISPSVPFLRAHEHDGKPAAITFIGFFKCDESAMTVPAGNDVSIIRDEPEFRSPVGSETGPFRMVRVRLISGEMVRETPAHSDTEVVQKKDFDWSEVSSTRREGEAPSQNVMRTRELWLATGICPNPRMYEVFPSAWVEECGLSAAGGWHHYLFLGHESAVEVIAKGWEWEAGQVVM